MKLFYIAGCGLLFVLILFFIQHKMIYFPRTYDAIYEPLFKNVTELAYETEEGSQTAFYVSPKSSKLPENLWILFGGNASLALDWIDTVKSYPDKSAGFLLIDYPGYGKCKGKASPKSILASTEKAFERLCGHLKLEPSEMEKRLNVMGHSLGAAAALLFAAKHQIKRVVLVSPFTSLRDMARRVVGTPLCYILRHNYDNKERLSELVAREMPPKITIIHGDLDDVVPVEMGRELAKIFHNHLDYYEIKNCDHNSIIFLAESRIFSAMLGFLVPPRL